MFLIAKMLVNSAEADLLYRGYLLATIIGVVGALIGLVFLIRQTILLRENTEATKTSAMAAERAATVAERSLKISQSADVLIERASLVNPADRQGIEPHSRIAIVLKNFGNSRASNVDIRIGLDVPGVTIPPSPGLPKTTLGAHDTRTMYFNYFGAIFEPSVLARIISGELRVRFEGEVIYTDVFGELHTTKCSGLFHPIERTFVFDQNDA